MGATPIAVAEKTDAASPAPTIVQVLFLLCPVQRIIKGEKSEELTLRTGCPAPPVGAEVGVEPKEDRAGGGPGKGRGRTADLASPWVLQTDLKVRRFPPAEFPLGGPSLPDPCVSGVKHREVNTGAYGVPKGRGRAAIPPTPGPTPTIPPGIIPAAAAGLGSAPRPQHVEVRALVTSLSLVA